MGVAGSPRWLPPVALTKISRDLFILTNICFRGCAVSRRARLAYSASPAARHSTPARPK
jgi:hypothetical protein